MKTNFIMFLFTIFSFSSVADAQTLRIKDYNYQVRDISSRGLHINDLYQKMNRKLVRSKDSICSNRAHMWVWDFKVSDIDSPKIFLFFTPKTGHFDGVSWWYHVSPLVNQQGKLWVMDAGYPSKVKGPLSIANWLRTFNGDTSVCKEIKISDTDLIEKMFEGNAFPEETRHGKYNCYYKITPPGYWTPGQVGKNLLGKDGNGRPMNFNRDEIDQEEVLEACIEASTTPLGWVWGTTLNRCRYFINHGTLKI